MIKEDMKLLIKDISGRLDYGVKFHCYPMFADGEDEEFDNTIVVLDTADWQILDEDHKDYIPLREIMPYLRPLSAMTEKEINQLSKNTSDLVFDAAVNANSGYNIKTCASSEYMIDYLNEHMLDYRGLIERGLALEAPKDMYNF